MKNLKLVLVGAFVLTLLNNTFADAEAKRKNRCRGNDRFFKANASTKGGTSNCGNGNVGFGWTCSESVTPNNIVSIVKRHASSGAACSCGDFANPNLVKAAEASAQSKSNALWASYAVYQTGCGFPNRWKAGTSSDYQISPLNFPTVF